MASAVPYIDLLAAPAHAKSLDVVCAPIISERHMNGLYLIFRRSFIIRCITLDLVVSLSFGEGIEPPRSFASSPTMSGSQNDGEDRFEYRTCDVIVAIARGVIIERRSIASNPFVSRLILFDAVIDNSSAMV